MVYLLDQWSEGQFGCKMDNIQEISEREKKGKNLQTDFGAKISQNYQKII